MLKIIAIVALFTLVFCPVYSDIEDEDSPVLVRDESLPYRSPVFESIEGVADGIPCNLCSSGQLGYIPFDRITTEAYIRACLLDALYWMPSILITSTSGAGCLLVLLILRRNRERILEWLFCGFWWFKVLSWLTVNYNEDYRKSFRRLVVTTKPRLNHAHGASAGRRGAATSVVNSWIQSQGCTTYGVGASEREPIGYHGWHIAKDVSFKPQRDDVTDDHIISMVDVDYYVDLPEWLNYRRPILCYTFMPQRVAGQTEDAVYWVNEDNSVTMKVNGGGMYKHQLWDYSDDCFVVDYGLDALTIKVERVQVSPDRVIVGLFPVAYTKYIGWCLPGRRLARREFVKDGVAFNSYLKKSNLFVSAAPIGSVAEVSIAASDFTVLKIRFDVAKKPTIWDITNYLRSTERYGKEDCNAVGALLWPLLNSSVKIKQIQVEGNDNEPMSYVVVNGYIAPHKPIGREMFPALVDNPSVSPAEGSNNDSAAVDGRITLVNTGKVPPTKYNQYAQSFMELLIPVAGVGSPWTTSQVIECQTLPMQRGRNEKVEPWISMDTNLLVRAFMKHEAGKITYPRNISQCDTSHCLEMSRYSYAFTKDVLYGQPWYAPGLLPRQIAQRLADLATKFLALSETDFSKFDGTVTEWLRRMIESAAFARYFAPEYREQVIKLLDKEIRAGGVTKSGERYDPLSSRLSGSPLTTPMNSLINAFVCFCALIEAGWSAEDAFKLLGLVAGDDGVTPAQVAVLDRVAKDLGLDLKAASRVPGGDPISFLSRFFEDPWSGALGSIQNPARALKKLHITYSDPQIGLVQAAANKAFGYLCLDPTGSGLMNSVCSAIIRCACKHNVEASLTFVDAPYVLWSQIAEGKTLGEIDTWPQANYDRGLELTAWSTGMELSYILELIEYLDELVNDFDGLSLLAGELHVPGDAPNVPHVIVSDPAALLPLPMNRPRPHRPTPRSRQRANRRRSIVSV